mgnify:CR=1 FL=1
MRSMSMGIIMFIGGLVGLINVIALFRHPERLKYDSFRYRAIKGRIRRWPRKSKEHDLSLSEVKSYAKINIVLSSIVVAIGVVIIVLSLFAYC